MKTVHPAICSGKLWIFTDRERTDVSSAGQEMRFKSKTIQAFLFVHFPFAQISVFPPLTSG